MTTPLSSACRHYKGSSHPRTILLIGKYPPIEGGVSAHNFWLTQALCELNYRVIVLTNADEVESAYRMHLSPADRRKLNGYRISGRIKVVSTSEDERVFFVPSANPYLTKIVSLGLEIIRKHRPRFIFSSYLEPYGVAALALSRLTGVSYVIQHAGSDIGRLILSPQVRTVYEEVLRQASAIATVPQFHERFSSLGIPSHRFVPTVPCRLPDDVFFPKPASRKPGSPLRLISYGKVGPSKGTDQLLAAIRDCRKRRMPVMLTTHWGGYGAEDFRKVIMKSRALRIIIWRGFVAHWRIAESLREAHVGIYLENGFDIPFHTPIGPLECWACGRPVIVSEEMAEKEYIKAFAQPKDNCFVVKGSRLDAHNIRLAVEEAFDTVFSLPFRTAARLASSRENVLRKTEEMLTKIASCI